MGREAKATVAEVREALARLGNNKRRLALALVKPEARVHEWLKRADDAASGVTREHLARAVAAALGAPDPAPLDLIGLTSGPLTHIEDLATQVLEAVRDARARLGAAALGKPTPLAEADGRAILAAKADADATRPKRKKG